MLRPKRKTWFFVADGAKARLFESLGRKEAWTLVDEWRNEAGRASSSKLGEARPGRGHKIGSSSRYAVEEASPHDKAEDEFLRERATYLNMASLEETYDQLVLSAPPRALGVLRKSLSNATTSNYIAVLDKDLTNLPDHELYTYFQQHIERW